MNPFRKFVALAAALALSLSAHLPVNADTCIDEDIEECYCADTGGYGYESCRKAPCIAPTIALATLALVAIVAVAVQNSGHGSGHCHD